MESYNHRPKELPTWSFVACSACAVITALAYVGLVDALHLPARIEPLVGLPAMMLGAALGLNGSCLIICSLLGVKP
jgi:hypothetical protein